MPMNNHAWMSAGMSASHLYGLAVAGLDEAIARAQSILDLGCGRGELGEFLRRTYIGRLDGVDVVAYPDFRSEFYDRFIQAELNSATPWVNGICYDLVFAVEVIEHLENPRSFCRLAARLLQAGGLLVITTPNPTSLSSLVSLVKCGTFREFRNGRGMYPAHITPVLPLDACRILTECELEVQPVTYSHYGRIPFMTRTYQSLLPFLGGALFSDNYRIIGRAQDISGDESSFITRTGK
jgi:SAM-dependent methyltransferase